MNSQAVYPRRIRPSPQSFTDEAISRIIISQQAGSSTAGTVTVHETESAGEQNIRVSVLNIIEQARLTEKKIEKAYSLTPK